ncbi:Precorrin-3B methylase [Leptolyngbya sp. NK1-12]|uniref:Precorrin-3B methylase n=1 Tax=Leptolyngbya sp. NK1-12 TaxID=2547451 RepID=A0AA97AJD1_9CYAN|nr:Precorrin-3B methylase [Leptolyngbya sp. NK1-12]MBF2047325.1 Precorrin-3B methylase [Elainella sp. C42_A2020_010]WNZ24781.1 Precorrin-3B methylase [Leptolyngbya sp. NK1-12]
MAKQNKPPTGAAPVKEVVKEVCRRIRVARSYWDAHNNRACRGERERALALYNTLTKEQKDQIPQELRVWLRYRSEKYFGPHRTPPKAKRKPK